VSTEERIRVVVADDHAVVRQGIRTVLASDDRFEVVAEAASGDEALALATEHEPDVLLLDITMPGMTGLEVASRLREAAVPVRMLVLSMHDRPEYVLEAVRAGAHGYLLKDTGPRELREAVRAVHEGETYFSPTVAERLTAALRGELERESRRGPLQLLTQREQEVLRLIAGGRTNKEIAAELGISPRTVESHRESLTRKLRIRSIAGLTRFAIEMGIAPE
jgi:DNA-binding NarL/FixJ family response regulator